MHLPLHPRSAQLVTHLLDHLPQSLLLSGPDGVGLSSVADQLAGNNRLDDIFPLNAKGERDPQGTIAVDAIRELHNRTRSKHTDRQIVVIAHADRMNSSSQSAFLKLLEEPNESIYFILLSHAPERLKNTILSRVQHHTIQAITPEQTEAFIKENGITDEKKKAQLQFVANGLPELITDLIADEALFLERAEVINDARKFIQGSLYNKLCLAQAYHSDRDRAVLFVDTLISLTKKSMNARPQSTLIPLMEHLLQAREQLSANANIRLTLAVTALS